jgi:hypothetical protein
VVKTELPSKKRKRKNTEEKERKNERNIKKKKAKEIKRNKTLVQVFVSKIDLRPIAWFILRPSAPRLDFVGVGFRSAALFFGLAREGRESPAKKTPAKKDPAEAKLSDIGASPHPSPQY